MNIDNQIKYMQEELLGYNSCKWLERENYMKAILKTLKEVKAQKMPTDLEESDCNGDRFELVTNDFDNPEYL